MIEGHGGDIYGEKPVHLDFSISVNPLGLPAPAARRAAEALRNADRYPDPACRRLREKLSALSGLPGEWYFFGNGAAELIFDLVRAVKPRRACLLAPGFLEYERALRAQGCEIAFCDLKEEEGFRLFPHRFLEQAEGAQMVFLCNPENPIGRLEDLEPLAHALLKKGVWLAVDECFLALSGGRSLRRLLKDYDRLCILDGLTKSHAMAGLRLGYVMSSNQGLLKTMEAQGQPWRVSLIAQEAAQAALSDGEYMREARELIGREQARVSKALLAAGFTVFPSDANFILFKDGAGENKLGDALREQGILIRSCANFRGLDGRYYRIGLKRERENDCLLEAIERLRRGGNDK